MIIIRSLYQSTARIKALPFRFKYCPYNWGSKLLERGVAINYNDTYSSGGWGVGGGGGEVHMEGGGGS